MQNHSWSKQNARTYLYWCRMRGTSTALRISNRLLVSLSPESRVAYAIPKRTFTANNLERNRGSLSLSLWPYYSVCGALLNCIYLFVFLCDKFFVVVLVNYYYYLLFCSTESYLGDSDLWDICEEPENIVQFNIGLFSALLVAACLELLLCGFQVFNGLFGCICGTCGHKEVCTLDTKVTISKGQIIYLLRLLLIIYIDLWFKHSVL